MSILVLSQYCLCASLSRQWASSATFLAYTTDVVPKVTAMRTPGALRRWIRHLLVQIKEFRRDSFTYWQAGPKDLRTPRAQRRYCILHAAWSIYVGVVMGNCTFRLRWQPGAASGVNLVQRIISSNVSFLPGKMLKGQCSLRWTLKEMKPSMVLLSTQCWGRSEAIAQDY
jgi:hypothetical protein